MVSVTDQHPLHLVPLLFIDDGAMVSRVGFILVSYLADVNGIFQYGVERPSGEGFG